MKIALVTPDYPPSVGGVARYLSNLVRVSSGSIDAFAPKTAPGPFSWWPSIFQIRSFKSRRYDRVLVSHLVPFGTAAWIAKMIGGLSYVVIVHGLDLRAVRSSKRKTWLAHQILKNAKIVVVNSAFVAGEIRAFDPTLNPQVLTPGVEPMVFPDRSVSRAALSVKESDFIILSVARLVERKGIDTLIKMLTELPDRARLVVIGDGPDRERLQRLSNEVSDRVTFITNATDEERNRWYAVADVFAFVPRDLGNDVEGFGIVCLEAALAGLPVIAGTSGGVPETVVDQQTGVLVNPADRSQISRTIRRFMDHPDERQRFGRAGRERALRDFRWEDRWTVLKDLL